MHHQFIIIVVVVETISSGIRICFGVVLSDGEPRTRCARLITVRDPNTIDLKKHHENQHENLYEMQLFTGFMYEILIMTKFITTKFITTVP